MGCLSATWEVRGSAQASSPSQLCPAVTTCSGVRSVPTRSGSVTGEDWPPPQVTAGCRRLLSLVQYSHCVLHREQNTFHLAPRTSWSVSPLHCRRPTARAPTGIPQRSAGSPGACPTLSEVSTRGSRTSGTVGGTAGQALHGWSGSATNCQCPVGTDNCPEPCGVCCLYGNQVPSNQG